MLRDRNYSRLDSFRFAVAGLGFAFKTQKNLRIHCLFMFLAALAGFVLSISTFEWLVIIGVSVLVICMELVNTAVEYTVSLYAEQYHMKAKIAKDVAAAAVLFAALGAVVAGIIVFLPKMISIGK